MNEFGFIDYKRPIGPRSDFRTSSYRSHVYYSDASTYEPKLPAGPQLRSEPQNRQLTSLVSEQMEQYPRKELDTCFVNNPPLKERTTIYMKPYEEKRFVVPKLLTEQTSIYKSDFRHETPAPLEPIPQYNLPSAVKHTLLPGKISKTTTQRIDYAPYSAEQQLGIGAKDQITYWSWIKEGPAKRNVRKLKEDMCEHRPRCMARRNEFQTSFKPVPNKGLTSEMRSNYALPLKRSEEKLHVDLKQNFSCLPAPLQMHTENKIYGSGERLDKYINIQALRRNVSLRK